MNDLISRDKIYEAVYSLACASAGVIDGISEDYAYGLLEASNLIAQAQAVDVLPVRRAHWIMHPYGAECSDCKRTFRIPIMSPTVMPPKPWWRFCPSCGAQIVEESEKEEQPCD